MAEAIDKTVNFLRQHNIDENEIADFCDELIKCEVTDPFKIEEFENGEIIRECIKRGIYFEK